MGDDILLTRTGFSNYGEKEIVLDEEIKINDTLGELYCLEKNGSGKWMDRAIEAVGELQCSFNNSSVNLPNGIKIINDDKDGFVLGTTISSFLLRSYIVKHCRCNLGVRGSLSYSIPVNIILFSLNSGADNYIKNTMESIESVLNHPHFSNCKSIDDICKKLNSVKDLNNRFNTSEK